MIDSVRMKPVKILSIGLILAAAQAYGDTWNSFRHNRAGLKALQEKSEYTAHREFLKALEDDPLNLAVQMNIGLSFEANEEYEKAEKSYRGVLQLLPEKSPARFEPLFNLAGVLAKRQKLDEALKAYQECLDIRPDSIEVKTNIELLWQGGGGGKGDQNSKDQNGKEAKESKDQKDKDKDKGQEKESDKDKNQNQEKPDNDKKSKPVPFDSKDLSKEDVRRILEEIKNQEQGIRAQEYEKNLKEAPLGKDW